MDNKVRVYSINGSRLADTIPRNARKLLKEKKAKVQTISPFAIRLLIATGHCGIKETETIKNL